MRRVANMMGNVFMALRLLSDEVIAAGSAVARRARLLSRGARQGWHREDDTCGAAHGHGPIAPDPQRRFHSETAATETRPGPHRTREPEVRAAPPLMSPALG